MSKKSSETRSDASRGFPWNLIGEPSVGQYLWESESGDEKRYYFLERSVWLMRLIRAIEVQDTKILEEILAAYKMALKKPDLKDADAKKLQDFKVFLEKKIKTALEEAKAPLETLIEYLQKHKNDSDEFLWMVSETFIPPGGSCKRISQRRGADYTTKNSGGVTTQFGAYKNNDALKPTIASNTAEGGDAAQFNAAFSVDTKNSTVALNPVGGGDAAQFNVASSVDTTKPTVALKPAWGGDAAPPRKGTPQDTDNLKAIDIGPSPKEIILAADNRSGFSSQFASVNRYQTDFFVPLEFGDDPDQNITKCDVWGWISVIQSKKKGGGEQQSSDAKQVPGLCKTLPRAIARRLEIGASARYIAIASRGCQDSAQSSCDKRLNRLFRCGKYFGLLEKQIKKRCDYYREDELRKELEKLRRLNGSNYSALQFDVLKTSSLDSNLWDTIDKKLGLEKAMKTFESAIDSHLKHHGDAARNMAREEKKRGENVRLFTGAALSAFALTEVVKTVFEWAAVWKDKTTYHFFAEIAKAGKDANTVAIELTDKSYHTFESWASGSALAIFLLVIILYFWFHSIQVDDSTEEPSSHHH